MTYKRCLSSCINWPFGSIILYSREAILCITWCGRQIEPDSEEGCALWAVPVHDAAIKNIDSLRLSISEIPLHWRLDNTFEMLATQQPEGVELRASVNFYLNVSVHGTIVLEDCDHPLAIADDDLPQRIQSALANRRSQFVDASVVFELESFKEAIDALKSHHEAHFERDLDSDSELNYDSDPDSDFNGN